MKQKGFTLMELAVASAIMSISLLASASLLQLMHQKTKVLNDKIDASNSMAIVKASLNNLDICSANFQNSNIEHPIYANNIYDINADQTINRDKILFGTRESEVSNSKAIYSLNLTEQSENAEIVKDIFASKLTITDGNGDASTYLYYKKSPSGQITQCTTAGIQPLLTKAQETMDCSTSTTGLLRYNFANKEPEVCVNSLWQGTDKIKGSYTVTVYNESKCQIANPHTKDCTCPSGYESKKTYTFMNKNCVGGVHTYYLHQDYPNQVPPGEPCGTVTFNCIKNT